MLHSNIRVGLKIQWRDQVWRIEEMILDHEQLLLRSRQGATSQLSPNDFRTRVSTGDIQFLVPGEDGVLQPVDADWREQETERACEHRVRKEFILRMEREARADGKTLREARTDISVQCEAKGWLIPCERTLREWRRDSRYHESCLSPQWHRCGNRRQGVDEIFLQAMKAIVELMLGHDRVTMIRAWKFICVKYNDLCKAANVTPKHYSPRRLSQFMRLLDWKTIQKLRLDPRTSAALARIAVCLHTADYFWEMVEMDAGYLPIWIRNDEGETITQVVMYIAIDVATGYVLGLYLTTQDPNVMPFIECLRSVYLPMPNDFDQKYEIQHRLPAFGKPVVLKVDNGPEFAGKAATEVVRQLHSDISHCKPYTPQEKPHVERAIGVIKRFVHSLPGSTYSSVTKQKRTPPAKEKLLTLEELKGRIYRYVYDEYAFQPNELRSALHKKAVTPYHLWQEMSKNVVPGEIVLEEEFQRVSYCERYERTLQHYGIEHDTHVYTSEAITKLHARYGPGQRYEIRSSQLSANVIYVDPGDGGELILAYSKTLDKVIIDRPTDKKLRAKRRADGKTMNEMSEGNIRRELDEMEHEAQSSSPKKRAQIAEKVKHAEAMTRKTMKASTDPLWSEADAAPDSWDFNDESLSGRDRGDF